MSLAGGQIGSAIGSGGSAGGSVNPLGIVESLFNMGTGIYGIARNNWLQEQQWNREDNAVQRRVADLKAAGLSPTLAAGSAASSATAIRAPDNQVPKSDFIERQAAALALENERAQIAKTQAQTRYIESQRTKVESFNENDLYGIEAQLKKLDVEFKSKTFDDRVAYTAANTDKQQMEALIKSYQEKLQYTLSGTDLLAITRRGEIVANETAKRALELGIAGRMDAQNLRDAALLEYYKALMTAQTGAANRSNVPHTDSISEQLQEWLRRHGPSPLDMEGAL